MTLLVLVVGFLGAGKTTYIRRLLPELAQQGLDPHLIINDFQNAKLDAELLHDLAGSVVPINGSCVCCGSRDELLEALENFEHRPGRIVVIETNGTTDSEELVEMLSLEPKLDRFTLPAQVSLIDGKRWQKRFWHNSLELDQVRTANFLFVSRWDELDERRRRQVDESLTKHRVTGPRMEPAELAKELARLAAEVAVVESRARATTGEHDCCGHDHEEHEHHPDHDAAHCHSTHHFASLQIRLPERVSRASLEQFLRRLPEEVIRAKGLVRLSETPDEFHVFQKVDRVEEAQLLPIGNTSRLSTPVGIFVGPNLPEDVIRAGVAALTEEAATAQR